MKARIGPPRKQMVIHWHARQAGYSFFTDDRKFCQERLWGSGGSVVDSFSEVLGSNPEELRLSWLKKGKRRDRLHCSGRTGQCSDA